MSSSFNSESLFCTPKKQSKPRNGCMQLIRTPRGCCTNVMIIKKTSHPVQPDDRHQSMSRRELGEKRTVLRTRRVTCAARAVYPRRLSFRHRPRIRPVFLHEPRVKSFYFFIDIHAEHGENFTGKTADNRYRIRRIRKRTCKCTCISIKCE